MLTGPVADVEHTTEALLQLRPDAGRPIDLLKAKSYAGHSPTGLEQPGSIIKMDQCDTGIIFVHIHLKDRAHLESTHPGEQPRRRDPALWRNKRDPVAHPHAKRSRELSA